MSWRDQAQCIGVDPARFFPEPNDQQTRKETAEFCHRCPVMIECRTEAVKMELNVGTSVPGVWGGMTRDARIRWARKEGIIR